MENTENTVGNDSALFIQLQIYAKHVIGIDSGTE